MAAWFDHALAKRNVSHRIALTALFGYAISYLPLAVPYWVGFAHGPEVLLFGLIGAVPSAVCSWLATEGTHVTLFHHHDRIRSSGRV